MSAQRYGWFVPSVSLSFSSGDFGGAPGSSVPSMDNRQDRSLMPAYSEAQLTADALDDLVNYLQTLRAPTPEKKGGPQ